MAIVTHLFYIFCAKTFLAINEAITLWVHFTQKIWHKGLHATTGKECCRIVHRHNGGRRNNYMPSLFEIIQICFANFIDCHSYKNIVLWKKWKCKAQDTLIYLTYI